MTEAEVRTTVDSIENGAPPQSSRRPCASSCSSFVTGLHGAMLAAVGLMPATTVIVWFLMRERKGRSADA